MREGNAALQISALIPTYNRRVHMMRAIDSVLAQTAPATEIVVVDDGSTDGTYDAVRERYGSSVRIFAQRNQGVSAARMRAVAEARCEWVAFLDSDDVWLPSKLERQMKIIHACGTGFGLCVTNASFVGSEDFAGTAFEVGGWKTDQTSGSIPNPLALIAGALQQKRMIPFLLPSYLVLRSLVMEAGGFDTNLSLLEDVDLLVRLCFRTNLCFTAERLLVVDRTSEVSRLSDTCGHKDDQAYDQFEKAYRKILGYPEWKQHDGRALLESALISFYYGWARERISGFHWMAAWECLGKARNLGQSYRQIAWNLASNALRKLARVAGAGPALA
jgi:glycosyltransferase involved in cell wall biosynthesis